MYLPPLKQKPAQQAVTSIFMGINRAQEIQDGEFAHEMNLSTREYPMLCPRKSRGIGETINGTYRGMMDKNGKMVVIIGNRVEYGGEVIEGITLSEDADMLPKRMVGFGAYVVIFPDKVFFNSIDVTDCGSLEAEYHSEGPIQYSMARLDGEDYDNITESSTAPSDPDNGDYWLDTSTSPHRLMMYSEVTGLWQHIETVYTRIAAAGIDESINAGDTVEISGIAFGTGEIAEQAQAMNGTQYIYDKGEGWITILGLLDESSTQTEGSITIERRCPDLDFVVEESNRLWGCHYGPDKDGKTLNEIYACKLGDFRNWRVYQGISTDSYTVSIGSDGPFTGAISYAGMPMFFKEDCVHKIYGNKPSNYQVMTTQMHGVQRGSEKSLCNVGGIVFYLSPFGVEIFDGSMPESVSLALGQNRMRAGVAGTIDRKYYLSVLEDEEPHLYVYDLRRNIWHEESTEGVKEFANTTGDLCMMLEHRIDTVMGTIGASEGLVAWYAETGMQGWEQHSRNVMGAADDKYITRYQLRAVMPVGSKMRAYLAYNGGPWEEKLSIENGWSDTRTLLMPVFPKRCDHMKMRIEGEGEIKLHSITRNLSGGGDGRHG